MLRAQPNLTALLLFFARPKPVSTSPACGPLEYSTRSSLEVRYRSPNRINLEDPSVLHREPWRYTIVGMAAEGASRAGSRIRQARQRAGLSLARLADVTGVSKSYLVRLETDPTSNPSLEVLRRIADALDITVADLVGAPRIEFAMEDADVPPTLRAFADEARLTNRELDTLASIRWRKGQAPRTRERWRYILDSLRASRTFDEDHEE